MFQYEKFNMIGKEEGLGYGEIVFMIALLLVILSTVVRLWYFNMWFIHGMSFVKTMNSDISVDYYKKDW